MRKEDVKIGMKVVPHGKTVGFSLDESNSWRTCKRNKQKFLYVTNIRGDIVFLNNQNNTGNGDYFRPEDFEPYTEMKYKVGDRVKIRRDLQLDQRYNDCFYIDSMDVHKGKETTIKSINEYMGFYKLDLDDGYMWTDDMLEKAEEVCKEGKFQVGDLVQVIDDGKLYTHWDDFTPEKISKPYKWKMGCEPKYYYNYKIIYKNYHTVRHGEGIIYTILDQSTNQIYVIGEKGLKSAYVKLTWKELECFKLQTISVDLDLLKPTNSKFKVGDRVRVKQIDLQKATGEIGTIAEVNKNDVAIYFDKNVDGWGKSDLNIPKGHGWYVVYEDIELIKEVEQIKVTRIGKATIVILPDGRKGVAKCHPDDTYDESVGLMIAYQKAKGIYKKDIKHEEEKKTKDLKNYSIDELFQHIINREEIVTSNINYNLHYTGFGEREYNFKTIS